MAQKGANRADFHKSKDPPAGPPRSPLPPENKNMLPQVAHVYHHLQGGRQPAPKDHRAPPPALRSCNAGAHTHTRHIQQQD